MAWDEDMTILLREMVNDPNSTTYTDARLVKVLILAAFQVKQEITFDTTYTIDIANENISPDPTATATKDESFTNLVCLKAASIADHGSAILAARRAIAVKDGSSAIDLRGSMQGWLALLEKGWKAVYDQAKKEFILGQAAIAGAMVLTPFRTSVSPISHYMFGPREASVIRQ